MHGLPGQLRSGVGGAASGAANISPANCRGRRRAGMVGLYAWRGPHCARRLGLVSSIPVPGFQSETIPGLEHQPTSTVFMELFHLVVLQDPECLPWKFGAFDVGRIQNVA